MTDTTTKNDPICCWCGDPVVDGKAPYEDVHMECYWENYEEDYHPDFDD